MNYTPINVNVKGDESPSTPLRTCPGRVSDGAPGLSALDFFDRELLESLIYSLRRILVPVAPNLARHIGAVEQCSALTLDDVDLERLFEVAARPQVATVRTPVTIPPVAAT